MIKPCQCGRKVRIITDAIGVHRLNPNYDARITCPDCLLSMSRQADSFVVAEENLIKEWNNRPREDELVTMLKRLVNKIESDGIVDNFPVFYDAKKMLDKYEGGE